MENIRANENPKSIRETLRRVELNTMVSYKSLYYNSRNTWKIPGKFCWFKKSRCYILCHIKTLRENLASL